MSVSAVPLADGPVSRRFLGALITEQVRVLLEDRAVRLAAIGAMLVVASLFSLVPMPFQGIDAGWMFIVPVAVSAIAAGLKEGIGAAFAASALCALYATAKTGELNPSLMASVLLARFILYGLTAAFLGSFAEAHQMVQSSLRQLATLDPLTKVNNVARFYDELSLLESLRQRFAIVVVDLDELKSLNDRYGHQAGSAAIQAVANCLRRVVRGSDCVARYGGDEFVLLLKDADRPGAEIVASRIREELAQEINPFALDVPLRVSIGIALYDEDGTTSEALLAAADAEMYADKRSRKVAVR